ncbi:MAG: hypothetical protein WCD00_15505 [Desulfuromonadaceae bacterium]
MNAIKMKGNDHIRVVFPVSPGVKRCAMSFREKYRRGRLQTANTATVATLMGKKRDAKVVMVLIAASPINVFSAKFAGRLATFAIKKPQTMQK